MSESTGSMISAETARRMSSKSNMVYINKILTYINDKIVLAAKNGNTSISLDPVKDIGVNEWPFLATSFNVEPLKNKLQELGYKYNIVHRVKGSGEVVFMIFVDWSDSTKSGGFAITRCDDTDVIPGLLTDFSEPVHDYENRNVNKNI